MASLFPDSVQKNKAILHAGTPKQKINKHIYGHFAEHLGRCIYDGFFVRPESKINNTNGIRNDVIDALKRLKIPNLRWPGGCFADTYHWKEGIGPLKDRPLIVNTHWGGVTEDNSFGTHNFLDLCELLNTEPYISGNVGSGTVQELSDWVQYTNFNGQGPMSALRRANGREDAWKVKFWGLGNEAWGCGGNMTAEYYANEYRKFASFMVHWADGEYIYRIASGANSDDYHWTETLMKNIPHFLLDGIGVHHYAVIDWKNKGSDVDFTQQQYFATMQKAWYMEEVLAKHISVMDKYDKENKIAVIVDEWGGWYNVEAGTNPGFLYQQNTMRDAMIAAVTLNIFNNYSHRVRMANLAQTINVLQAVILTQGEKLILTPTYYIMEMYKVHQDALLIPLEIQSGVYKNEGQELKSISGSASVNQNGTIHISIANIDPHKEQEIVIEIKEKKIITVTARIITSTNITDHNTFEHPDNIVTLPFNNFQLVDNFLHVKLPPISAIVLALNGKI